MSVLSTQIILGMRKKLWDENRKSAEKEFTSCSDKEIWKIAEMKVCSFQIGIDMFYYMHVGRMIYDLRNRNLPADNTRFIFILILIYKLRV